MSIFYLIVEYKDMLSNVSIPFGVIVHDGQNVRFKFDLSSEKLNKIQEIGVNVDPDTFTNLSKTFQQNFLDKAVIITSDSLGRKIEVKPNTVEFLDYLHDHLKGSYRYSERQPIIGATNLDTALKQIFTTVS